MKDSLKPHFPMQSTESILEDCEKIIDSFLEDPKLSKHLLRSHYCLVDFYEPVKWEALGLYDYLQVVKKPMDLSTVKVFKGNSNITLRKTSLRRNIKIRMSLLMMSD